MESTATALRRQEDLVIRHRGLVAPYDQVCRLSISAE